jgi:hypothetical protein
VFSLLQESYRALVEDSEDDVDQMVRQASDLVETVADDSWLEWGEPLMPSFVRRAEEAREREVEQRRLEAERLKEQQRRKRIEAEQQRREEKEKERLARETAASRLSPTSSRTAARKTSNSSFAEEDEVAASRPKSKSKGQSRASKGKAKASTSTPRAFQEPKFELPAGAALVGPSAPFIAPLLMPVSRLIVPATDVAPPISPRFAATSFPGRSNASSAITTGMPVPSNRRPRRLRLSLCPPRPLRRKPGNLLHRGSRHRRPLLPLVRVFRGALFIVSVSWYCVIDSSS